MTLVEIFNLVSTHVSSILKKLARTRGPKGSDDLLNNIVHRFQEPLIWDGVHRKQECTILMNRGRGISPASSLKIGNLFAIGRHDVPCRTSLANVLHRADGFSKVTKRKRERALSLNLLETNILKGGIFVNLDRVSFGLSHEQHLGIVTYGKHHNNRAVGSVDRDIVYDKASMLFSNIMSSTGEGL